MITLLRDNDMNSIVGGKADNVEAVASAMVEPSLATGTVTVETRGGTSSTPMKQNRLQLIVSKFKVGGLLYNNFNFSNKVFSMFRK